ncbi:carboxylesterase/lipase family protein [Microbacterium aurantiacum]|uniref:Carboxylic ester hydrolase n=1 Tax=Microbacterium aurantiacum TaxID=162393 RepID=A0ABT8FT05_9MICO|nr:carboxylesterase family protein [Microbacterium aurantiacum]MDN4464456.1 carboxylesterase family protein [Microbacterium aurantiacum]
MNPDPIVRITAGQVRGFWRGPAGAPGSSAAFLGIPFAEAPVGALRFAAPVPVAPWDGIRDAREYGATAKRAKPGEKTLIPEPAVPGEATLNVNVFTPTPGGDAALPVLVYIHGGGFTEGSPASPWYDGSAFTRDGVVTVTISYRLGFDGFGHIPGAPSNRGVRDWLAALAWVQENIAAFGGDPGHVTIAGQSAGGGAVLTLLGMPAAQGLFHAAWALSPALGDVSGERARTLTAKLAGLLGVDPSRDGFAGVTEADILAQQESVGRTGQSPLDVARGMLQDGLSFGPMIDGDLLARPTIEALRSGLGGDVPLVLGATDDEFTMITDGAARVLGLVPPGVALQQLDVPRERRHAWLAANAPQRRKGTAAVVGRYVGDVIFRSTVLRAADARAAAGGAAKTWAYRFTWPSPTIGWACHCLDVPFWFDALGAEAVGAIAGDAPSQALADAVHGAAVALIRDGDPGWPAWDPATQPTRVFDLPADGRASVVYDGYASVRALA